MRWIGITVLAIAVLGLSVLVAIVGWSAVRQNWANGDPWFSGFQFASLTTPLAAFIAAGVAITTARWGLRSAGETREKDHQRWEFDRQRENARRHTERRDATERTLRDRFHDLVKLMASSDIRAREGAAYAVVALADDWKAHYTADPVRAQSEQQVCINVLIAQLRDPLPPSMEEADRAQLVAFKQVIQGLISARLGRARGVETEPGDWSSFSFVFDGCTFHNLALPNRVLSGALVSFNGAQFSGERTSFNGARFSGERTSFDGAQFSSGRVWFDNVKFTGWRVSFSDARFDTPRLSFRRTQFSASQTVFNAAQFGGMMVTFFNAQFDGIALFKAAQFWADQVSFRHAKFTGPNASFERVHFAGQSLRFSGTLFAADLVSFRDAHFIGKRVAFEQAKFSGPEVTFARAQFASDLVTFAGAQFIGADLNVSEAVANFPRSELSSRTVGHFEDGRAIFDASPFGFPDCDDCRELAASLNFE